MFVIYGIWSEIDSTNFWKATLTLIVVSVAFAHGLLLLIPTLSPGYRWTQLIAIALISILTLQVFYLIYVEDAPDHDSTYRWVAVTSVFVVLMTFVVPICSKLQGGEAAAERLILKQVSGNTYEDHSGRKFQVTVLADDPQS